MPTRRCPRCQRLSRRPESARWRMPTDRPDESPDAGAGPAPAAPCASGATLVKRMGPDQLNSFEQRRFAAWSRDSLYELRIAIPAQVPRELAR